MHKRQNAGYYIWAISLADGSVISSHGATRSARYDLTLIIITSPLFSRQHTQIQQLYAGLDKDRMRSGYRTVAYGWTPSRQIKVFAQFRFDILSETQDCVFHVYATLDVTDRQTLSWQNISVRKVKDGRSERQPAEVTRLDGLL